MPGLFRQRWTELAAAFLKLGAFSYGGAAMMGIMHAEIVQRRCWLSNERYLHGVALVSVIPGPPAVQLAIFIGYDRAGWRGGLLSGLCFMLPAFFILLGLTVLYSTYGTVAWVRDALHGIAAVVLAIFAAAVYRLGKTALKSVVHVAVAVAAAALFSTSPFGIATVLLLAGCAGVALYHSPARGYGAAATILVLFLAVQLLQPMLTPGTTAGSDPALDPAGPGLFELALFFAKVSAFTFGGGLAILAFVQEHVVTQMQWLTPREFLDGIALGQLTPGPTLMIAAYVGYKLAGTSGAVVSAACIFAPAFFLVLPLMPVLERFEHARWIKAALQGINPAVIGCLIVTLAQLLPHAAPDAFGGIVLAAGLAAALLWGLQPLTLIFAAGILGIIVHTAVL